jgi:protein disulfide-isomerase A6
VSQAIFDEQCQRGEATNICFIAFLPDILDSGAKGRNKYVDSLKGASKRTRGFAFEFLWTQGGEQRKFEDAFNMSFGYPKLVAIHAEKKAFAVMVGAFDENNIVRFVNQLKSGKVNTKALPGDVPAIKTRAPWDGKDGTPPSEDL